MSGNTAKSITSSRPMRRRILAVMALLTLGTVAVASAFGASAPLSGTVSAGGLPDTTKITVTSPGTITATIQWSAPSAVLSLSLVDPNGTQVKLDGSTNNPKTITYDATLTGTYKVIVKAKSGSSDFTGSVSYPGVSQPSYAGSIGGGTGGHAVVYPSGLDVGPDGTVYVADTGNDQVAAYSADGTQQLWRVGVRGVKAAGNFNNPRDIAYLNGQVFVDDIGNNRVQVLDASTHAVVGTPWPLGTSSLGITAGKDVNGQNIILVSEDVKNQIAVFQPNGQPVCNIPVPVGSNGKPPLPRDAATNAAGKVYVAAYQNDQIDTFAAVNVSTSTCPTKISGSWGSSGDLPGQFKRPYGVALDSSGNVYVADSDNERVQEFNSTGSTVLHIYGDKTPANGGSGDLFQLRRVAVANGSVYAADLWGLHIDRFAACPVMSCPSPTQTYPATVTGPPVALFNETCGITYNAGGDLYVADAVNQRIQIFPAGSTGVSWGTPTAFGARGWGAGDLSGFNWPRDVSFAPATGTIWVADTKNNRLLEFLTDGTSTKHSVSVGGALTWPYAVDASTANLIVADTFANKVEALKNDGTGAVWSATTENGIAFKSPYDVAVANGVVYVADSGNKRIVELNATTGAYITSFGAGTLHSPQGVAVDPTSGSIWVSDT